jgi:hypothetical protein
VFGAHNAGDPRRLINISFGRAVVADRFHHFSANPKHSFSVSLAKRFLLVTNIHHTMQTLYDADLDCRGALTHSLVPF